MPAHHESMAISAREKALPPLNADSSVASGKKNKNAAGAKFGNNMLTRKKSRVTEKDKRGRFSEYREKLPSHARMSTATSSGKATRTLSRKAVRIIWFFIVKLKLDQMSSPGVL